MIKNFRYHPQLKVCKEELFFKKKNVGSFGSKKFEDYCVVIE